MIATYDLAVRNGGHSEYFAVFGVGRASEVRSVFEQLGAGVQRQILADAISRHMSRPGETGFIDTEHQESDPGAVDYSDLDAFYRGGQAETARLLERYMQVPTSTTSWRLSSTRAIARTRAMPQSGGHRSGISKALMKAFPKAFPTARQISRESARLAFPGERRLAFPAGRFPGGSR